MRIAIFASGSGSNFQAIAQSVQSGQLDVTIACVIYDKKDAYVKERAKQCGIPAYYVGLASFESKQAYEEAILKRLTDEQVDLIVLAGYMKLIGETLLQAYPSRIINIHPSLLPNFPGKSGIKDAFEAGVNQTGVTVHIVDAGMDTGPILKQRAVKIEHTDTLESLEEKIHQVEHVLYTEVIKEIMEGKYHAIRID